MMMIINTYKKFFWAKIQKSCFSFFPKAITIVFITLIVACNKKGNLHVESIKTASGWGYTIANDEKIIIRQTIIPVISNTKSFETEKDALKIGNLVVEKLNANLSPTVTKKDLILLDIKI
ncbi:DUF4907 domain-containing protein [Flavobacterium sp. LS1R49]|uniref:DUF4907 domain-containing protein n=1 Tax=Flavobacterium shii TaxID=2987687 RepID=A0A9X2ZEW2_9FLAO|nr:DUF4907 domain-containing protein [Flavobacterium shii]MCV9928507.1 DUF4907 domain-containing protein [Flavobacterium shii]